MLEKIILPAIPPHNKPPPNKVTKLIKSLVLGCNDILYQGTLQAQTF